MKITRPYRLPISLVVPQQPALASLPILSARETWKGSRYQIDDRQHSPRKSSDSVLEHVDDRLADCLAAASALFARSEPPSIRRPARIVRHTEFLECRVKSAIHRSRRPGWLRAASGAVETWIRLTRATFARVVSAFILGAPRHAACAPFWNEPIIGGGQLRRCARRLNALPRHTEGHRTSRGSRDFAAKNFVFPQRLTIEAKACGEANASSSGVHVASPPFQKWKNCSPTLVLTGSP